MMDKNASWNGSSNVYDRNKLISRIHRLYDRAYAMLQCITHECGQCFCLYNNIGQGQLCNVFWVYTII